jgi:DNA-binding CsgD family transcriptional regulator
MKLPQYLYTINKNNGYPLDQDEMKDVEQETTIFLCTKDYNDMLQKITARSFYSKALKKKNTRRTHTQQAGWQQDAWTDPEPTPEPDLQEQRRQQLSKLNFKSKTQEKIVKLLVDGKSYEEIRKRLALNSKQMRNHIYTIKTLNLASRK